MPGNEEHGLHLLGRRRGRNRAEGRRSGQLLIAALVAFSVAVVARGALAGHEQGDPALDYVLQCQGCHRADGRGVEAVGVPRMDGFVGKFLTVEGGRAYLVQVPGVAQAPLSDEAIAELLNWILLRFSPNELPVPFVRFSRAEVADYRSRTPIDVFGTRAALLARLAERSAATGRSHE